MDKCKNKKCPKGKICNPKSRRCVKLKGRVGRKLAKRKSKSRRKSVRKSKSKRKSVRKSKSKRKSVRKSKSRRKSVRKSKSRRKTPPIFKDYKTLPKEWSKNIKNKELLEQYLYIYSYWRYLREIGIFLWGRATHYNFTNLKRIKGDIFYEGITENDLEDWNSDFYRSIDQADADLEHKLSR